MEAPIYEKVKLYGESKANRYHTPGHIGKGDFPTSYFNTINKYDITELEGIDDMLSPTGCILEGEKLLSEAYNSYNSFFLTSGSTTGIFAMLYAVKDKGDSIIIDKNSHKSIYNAIQILNIKPIIIDTGYDNDNLPKLIEKEQIERALKENPNTIGVLVTTPDYFGRMCEIDDISEMVYKYGKLVLVDNAHGAHFVFNESFREKVSKYAHIWVTSNHKTLPVLTGGSTLHTNLTSFTDKLREGIRIFHTTSPNFLVLSSIDYARAYMKKNGYKYHTLKAHIYNFKMTLESQGIEFVKNDDFSRFVIDFKNFDITGEEVYRELMKKDIYAEMVYENKLVFIFTIFHTKEDFAYLLNAIIEITKKVGKKTKPNTISKKLNFVRKVEYLDAVNGEKELVNLEDSIGRVCAMNVGTYPPALPLITAGEVITKEFIEYIKNFERNAFGLEKSIISVLK